MNVIEKQVNLKQVLILLMLSFCLITISGQKRIDIKIDKNDELIFALIKQSKMDSVIFAKGLMPWSMITQFEFPIKDAYDSIIKNYTNKDCINYFNALIDQGFVGFAPVSLMSYLNDSLVGNMSCWFELTNMPGYAKEPVEQFLAKLRQLESEAGFNELYNANKKQYALIIENQQQVVKVENIVQDLERFFKYEFQGYHIRLIPMMWSGGAAIPLNTSCENVNYEPYIRIGPKFVKEGLPVFGTKESYSSVIFHEFSHVFLRRYLDIYKEQIAKYSHLHGDRDKELGYADWEYLFDETLTRVCQVVLTYKDNSKLIEKNIELQAKQEGFTLMPVLFRALKKHYIESASNVTLHDAFPEIISSLDSVSSQCIVSR